MGVNTRAAAKRWLAAHVGSEIDTVQVRPDGMVWKPGVRTLARKGTAFTLDNSTVRLTAHHVVLDIEDDLLRVEWLDDDGTTIHVTTYRPVYNPTLTDADILREIGMDEAADELDEHLGGWW